MDNEEKKTVDEKGILRDDQGNPPLIEEHVFLDEVKEDRHNYGRSWYWDKRHSGKQQGTPLDLGEDSYVLCAAGARGAGKTSMLTFLAEKCVYLYDKRIVANYPIEFGILYKDGKIKYHVAEMLDMPKLLNMDRDYQDCIILIAEAPQIINRLATMSWKNRLVNIFIQQLRHNKSSFIYDSQNERWVDSELQWQTDVLINCRDASKRDPRAELERGAKIFFEMQDKSGLWTGYPFEENYVNAADGYLLSKYIWGTFGTHYIHDVFESLRGAHMNLAKHEIGDNQEIEEGDQVPFYRRDLYRNAINVVTACLKTGVAPIKNMYQAMGKLDQHEKTIVGSALQDAGAIITGHGGSKYDFSNFNMADFTMGLKA